MESLLKMDSKPSIFRNSQYKTDLKRWTGYYEQVTNPLSRITQHLYIE